MTRITLRLDDNIRAALRSAARRRGTSETQFVAGLIRSATTRTWPVEVLALAGSVSGFPLTPELRGCDCASLERVRL